LEVPADIVLVVATIVAILSVSSIVASWTVRRWPWVPLISICVAAALFAYVHFQASDGLEPLDIPDAFISVAARVLN
jgi:Na+/serine symporter